MLARSAAKFRDPRGRPVLRPVSCGGAIPFGGRAPPVSPPCSLTISPVWVYCRFIWASTRHFRSTGKSWQQPCARDADTILPARRDQYCPFFRLFRPVLIDSGSKKLVRGSGNGERERGRRYAPTLG